MNLDVCKNCEKLKSSPVSNRKYRARCDFSIHVSSITKNKEGLLFVGAETRCGVFWQCRVNCISLSEPKEYCIRMSEEDLKLVEISKNSCPHYTEHLMFDINNVETRKHKK